MSTLLANTLAQAENWTRDDTLVDIEAKHCLKPCLTAKQK